MENTKLRENPYFEVEERLQNFARETEYHMTRFSDRVVENPWTFEEISRGTNPSTGNPVIEHIFREGEVIEEGKMLSEQNLGNLDVAIAILYRWRKHVDRTLLSLALKSDALEGSSLNGMIANTFVVTFDDLADGKIKVNRGYHDIKSGEVWS